MRFMGAGEPRRWRVGQVATATGVTVRRLHHYHENGLLVASAATATI